MTPYNDERIRDCINALYEQGIPVVTLNTDIENSRRIAYVGSNYTRSGATATGLLQLMTSGTVNVELSQVPPTFSVTRAHCRISRRH